MSIEAMKQALEALKDNRRSHYYCEDTWYSCPKHEDGCANKSEGDECNCGADEANIKIDAAIIALRQAIKQAEQIEPDLPPVEIGVDVTEHGTTVMAFYRRPNAVMEMFYSQFHPQPKQPKNPPIRIQNHTHTDHPMRHWDRTCPACVADSEPLANPIANQPETSGSPMQKPLFWYRPVVNGEMYEGPYHNDSILLGMLRDEKPNEWFPLYTAPPEVKNWQDIAEYRLKLMFDLAKRKEWVGLTDDEVVDLYCQVGDETEWAIGGLKDAMPFANLVEAKLKEKNT